MSIGLYGSVDCCQRCCFARYTAMSGSIYSILSARFQCVLAFLSILNSAIDWLKRWRALALSMHGMGCVWTLRNSGTGERAGNGIVRSSARHPAYLKRQAQKGKGCSLLSQKRVPTNQCLKRMQVQPMSPQEVTSQRLLHSMPTRQTPPFHHQKRHRSTHQLHCSHSIGSRHGQGEHSLDAQHEKKEEGEFLDARDEKKEEEAMQLRWDGRRRECGCPLQPEKSSMPERANAQM